MTLEEQALKTLWISKVGDGPKLPPDWQWGLWLQRYGPHAALAIIQTGRKQHGVARYENREMKPCDLARFCQGTARHMATAAGYVPAEQPEPQAPRCVGEPLPLGYIPRKAKIKPQDRPRDRGAVEFVVDDVDRYVPAEWQ